MLRMSSETWRPGCRKNVPSSSWTSPASCPSCLQTSIVRPSLVIPDLLSRLWFPICLIFSARLLWGHWYSTVSISCLYSPKTKMKTDSLHLPLIAWVPALPASLHPQWMRRSKLSIEWNVVSILIIWIYGFCTRCSEYLKPVEGTLISEFLKAWNLWS